MTPNEIHEARCQWRADLLNYTADLLEGAGLAEMAEQKRSEAGMHELDGNFSRELGQYKAAYRAAIEAAGDDEAARVAARETYETNASEVVNARDFWRQVGEATGTRSGFVQTVNNFAEPTDAELEASAS